MNRKAHWDNVYAKQPETEVSWYQADPKLSVQLIREVCPAHCCRLIDIGGGASVLVDRLLDAGFHDLAVLDVSVVALERVQIRLSKAASRVRWIVADVTEVKDIGQFDLWHDRAVFHFLTNTDDRRKYVELAERTVPPGGHLILSTFALDGLTRCSGLDVRRYDAASASLELGRAFALVKELSETHVTPAGKPQQFFYGLFRRV